MNMIDLKEINLELLNKQGKFIIHTPFITYIFPKETTFERISSGKNFFEIECNFSKNNSNSFYFEDNEIMFTNISIINQWLKR